MLACTSGHSDNWECRVELAWLIKIGLFPVSNSSGLMRNGNGVKMTGAWKADVAARMCTFNPVGSSSDTGSNFI